MIHVVLFAFLNLLLGGAIIKLSVIAPQQVNLKKQKAQPGALLLDIR